MNDENIFTVHAVSFIKAFSIDVIYERSFSLSLSYAAFIET